jgi:hypothetical protein
MSLELCRPWNVAPGKRRGLERGSARTRSPGNRRPSIATRSRSRQPRVAPRPTPPPLSALPPAAANGYSDRAAGCRPRRLRSAAQCRCSATSAHGRRAAVWAPWRRPRPELPGANASGSPCAVRRRGVAHDRSPTHSACRRHQPHRAEDAHQCLVPLMPRPAGTDARISREDNTARFAQPTHNSGDRCKPRPAVHLRGAERQVCRHKRKWPEVADR